MNDTNRDPVLIEIRNIKKWFNIGHSLIPVIQKKRFVKAVDGVSFSLLKREIFGLVGESGCGKTTLGLLLVGLIKSSDGRILFQGEDITLLARKSAKQFHTRTSMVFQDPYGCVNPGMTIENIVREPLVISNSVRDKKERLHRVREALRLAKLEPVDRFLDRYPSELSGGELQRVSIARSIQLGPEFIVLDEPASMIDVSTRAGILNLILELRRDRNLTFLLITHDLSVARFICDRIGVMYLGKMVELGPSERILEESLHPYTRALISAVPSIQARGFIELNVRGEMPDASKPPPGCNFHPRCPFAKNICKREAPELIEIRKGHYVACHFD